MSVRIFKIAHNRTYVLMLRLFCFARFRLYAFVEAAALHSIVLRYAGVPIATSVSLCTESRSYVLSFFRMVFFLPCDHGLDF